MPLRGENVGTAYVRILADGSGLSQSIRDEMEDTGPVVQGQGRRNSKEYTEAFAKEQESAPSRKRLRESLAKSLAQGDFLEHDFFRGSAWIGFRKSLESRFGEAGRVAGANLERSLAEGMTFEQLDNRLDNMLAEISKATAQIMKAEEQQQDEALRMNQRFDRERLQQQRDTLAEAYRMNGQFNRQRSAQEKARLDAFNDMLMEAYRLNSEFNRKQKLDNDRADFDFEQHTRQLTRNVERIETQFDRLSTATDKLRRGERVSIGSRREMLDQLESLRNLMTSAGGSTEHWEEKTRELDRRIRTTHPTLHKFSGLVNVTAVRSERLFGKGSRNNFLNFFGSMVGGLIRTVDILPKAIGGFTDFASSIQTAFRGAGGGFSGFTSGLGAFAKGVAPVVAGLAAVILGVAALNAVLAPLAVLLSGLTGIVVALAGSLGFALLGAITAVAGALVPMAAGIGVVVAGFLALDDAQKKVLGNNFRPVLDAFKDLGDIAAENIFGKTAQQAETLKTVVEGLAAPTRRISVAVRDVFDAWVEGLGSQGFRGFSDELGIALPGMIRKLGRIASQTIGGIGGLFLAAIPLVNRFLDWLDRVTLRFQNFTNSAEGRTKLEDFFERAGDSAATVGDFLSRATELLGDLLSAGKDTGDSLFRSMADSMQRLIDYIRNNPDAVQKWFDSARDLGIQLGNLVVEAGKFVAALDSPRAQAFMHNLLEITTDIIRFMRIAHNVASATLDALANLWSPVVVGAALARRAFGIAVNAARNFGTWVNNVARQINDRFVGALSRLPGHAARAIGAVVSFFRGLPGRAGSAANAIIGIIGNIFTNAAVRAIAAGQRMVNWFRGLPARIGGATAGIRSYIAERFNEAVAYVAGIPGRIVALFTGLGGRIMDAIGRVDIGSLIDIPSPGGGVPFIPNLASGGIVEGIRGRGLLRRVGEEGAEAVVPLDRDLSKVDPAVRWLSAIAQGLMPGMASGGTVGVGKTIDVGGITVVSNADPAAVAQELVNDLVGLGY